MLYGCDAAAAGEGSDDDVAVDGVIMMTRVDDHVYVRQCVGKLWLTGSGLCCCDVQCLSVSRTVVGWLDGCVVEWQWSGERETDEKQLTKPK